MSLLVQQNSRSVEDQGMSGVVVGGRVVGGGVGVGVGPSPLPDETLNVIE
ncbi:MAG: hypothetical protein QXT86_09065 [Archaeoglobaceae archaeon]